ncbi:MAG: EAL domain-containing protein [Clostridiaceae bacterium]|nr:EAL domain-containing protein [Clostridiaceae bacterium]
MEGIVKNKTILFLISSVIFATIALSILTIFNIESEIGNITVKQKKDALSHATEQIMELDMVLYGMNNEFLELEKSSINSIEQWFVQNKQNPLEVGDEDLKKLAKSLPISDIYIINKEGKVVHTSFELDKEVNLISKNSYMRDYLSKIYGTGKVYDQGIGFSMKNGKLNRYTYYSPLKSDYIIEISVDVKEYVRKKYDTSYYNFLFKDLFQFSKSLEKGEISIEIYNNNGKGTWALSDEGKQLDLTNEEFKQLKNNKELTKNKDGFTYGYYELNAPWKSFSSSQKFYVEIRRDFTAIERIKKQTIINSIKSSLVIIAIFYFLIRKFLNKFFIQKVQKINSGLLEISKGDYSQDITIAGKDEFAQIASNINIMKNRIKDRETKIRTMAYYDSITGLPNKELLKEEIDERIYMRECKGTCSMIILQIHNFKQITDIVGHIAGEEILLSIATFLKDRWKTAFISCKSDNEFAILEDFLNFYHMNEKIKDLMNELQKEEFIPSKSLNIVFNAGIVIYPEHGTTSEEILKNGDLVLHHIKNKGHNEYMYYSKEMEESLINRLVMEKELKEALIKDEIKVVYQPKVNTRTGRISSAEALVRWEKQDGQKIFPDEFIPLAEETGLIIDIGNYVLKKSCMQLKEWHERGLSNLKVSVNLSVVQFQQKNLIDVIKNIIQETKLEPNLLELEITESLLMEDISECNRILKGIRECGINIALDDFGKGYSSLNYLKSLQIDVLKIDKAFVDNIVNLEDKQVIIDALIQMAHGLNISVVAEGVETSIQAEHLKNQKCDELQGYFFSKPIDAETFEKLLTDDIKF